MTMGRLKLAVGKQTDIWTTETLLRLTPRHKDGTTGERTFSEQNSLIGWKFALDGELQQVLAGAPHVLLVLLVPPETSEFPELGSRPGHLPLPAAPLRLLDGRQRLGSAQGKERILERM